MADILPFTPAESVSDRDLRAERDALHRAYDIRPDLYRSLDERARMAAIQADVERDLRIMRWQRYVKAFCVAVAVFALVWFGGRELVAVLS